MGFKQLPLAIGVLLSANTLNANASLTSYTGAGGVGLVYSSLGDITWMADGNLFQTIAGSYGGGASAFVNAVIASVPSGKINDTPNFYDTPANSGFHNLSSSDFNTTSGQVTWFGAHAFTIYLNSINYGGSSQWRLPSADETGSELIQLYYSELGALIYPGTNGSDFGILGDGSYLSSGSAGPFVHAQTYAYWAGSEYAPSAYSAWIFNTYYGHPGFDEKDDQLYAWAVSSGQVAAVPLPAAAWLFSTALLGLLGLKRQGQQGN